MAIPLLSYSPKSQNQRVAGYEVGNEEQPKIYTTDDSPSVLEKEEIIWAAYRQIFSEHQTLDSSRQKVLESQLKFGQISVRQFVRGLAVSDVFRRRNYDTNSNYRVVELCVQRFLGRDVYSEREKITWSIVIATKGYEAFIDALINTEEYISNFGDNTVPYQRRRVLPQRVTGDVPFNLKTPRYDAYHRAQLGFPQIIWQSTVRSYVPQDRTPRAGDPALFLNMARSVNVRVTNDPIVSPLNLDYENLVPRKR